MSDKDERVKDKIKRYTHAQVTFDDLVYGIVDRQDQIKQLTARAEKAEARVENLAYYLRIYDHAHDSGNSVPGNIVAEARAAMKGLAEP